MGVEGELCLVAPRRARAARRALLQVGLALLATGAFGELAWSLVRLVRAHLRCTPSGEIRVKGVGEQLRVYEAGGCSPTLTS
jgi:hypothetical protein